MILTYVSKWSRQTWSYHTSSSDRPVEFILFDVYSNKLYMFEVMSEENHGIGSIHICGRDLGRYPALCSLISPIQLPETNTEHKYTTTDTVSKTTELHTTPATDSTVCVHNTIIQLFISEIHCLQNIYNLRADADKIKRFNWFIEPRALTPGPGPQRCRSELLRQWASRC